MAGGRPTKYTPDLLARANEYLNGGSMQNGEIVPTVVGLALHLGIAKSTCYDWAQHEDKAPFSDILTRVEAVQELKLVSGGLAQEFNPAITKMMLTKHGYSDRIEQAHTSPDGSMTPKAPESVDKAVVQALVDKLTD